MRNRILCLGIAIIMLLSFANCAYATSYEKTEDVEYMYEVLKALNIMGEPNPEVFVVPNTFKLIMGNTGAETTDYGLFREVSKRNFINYVCNMLYDSGYASEYNEGAVKAAENAGIIHPNQDDLYKPLYYEEAVTMLVRLLSYGKIAEEGGWPYGYMTAAKRLGLNEGITASVGDKLTLSDVIRLLYNTLNAPYAQFEYITENGTVYSTTSDVSFLYAYRKIYKIEGVVESTETAAISSELNANEGQIMIDGHTYFAERDFSNMLGLYVEAYVKESKSNMDTVIAVTAFNNEELVIDTGDIKSVSDDMNTITYYTDDREKSIGLSPSKAVLYNGQPKSCTKEDFKPLDGHIRLIDNNGDSVWDVVFISDYQTYIVDYVSTSNELIRAKFAIDGDDTTLDLEPDKERIVIIVAEDGTPMSISDIETGDVLRVAMSTTADKEVIFVEHTRKSVSGTIERISQKDDGTYISVDGKEYMVSQYYQKAQNEEKTKTLKLGDAYTFYLDSAGRVAYAEDTEESVKYGLVWGTSSTGVFTTEWKVRMFTADGEWVEYPFAERVDYNDTRETVDEDTFDNLPQGRDGNISLVCYSLNSKGEINMIKTPVAYTDALSDEFNVKTGLNARYRPNNTSFESETFITDGATIFMVNKEKLAETDSYVLGGLGDLSNDNDHTFNAYNVDDFGFAEILVIENNSSLKNHRVSGSDLFVVTDVGKGFNADGKIIGAVTGMYGAYEEITFYFDDNSYFKDMFTNYELDPDEEYEYEQPLKAGDVISITTDKKGRITIANVYYSITDTPVRLNWAGGIHHINTILRGTVIENDAANYRIKLDCGTKNWVARTALDNLVIIYDLEQNRIRRGSIGDIEEQAQVVMKIRQSKVMCIVAYQ